MPSDADKPEVKVFKFGEENLSDIVFIVGGEEFHCHRMARSPYFAALLTSNFKEKNEERIEIEADPVAFRRLMEILYDGIFKDYSLLTGNHFTIKADRYESRIKALWSEFGALLELADRFLVFDMARKIFQLLAVYGNNSCLGNQCCACATKLLISLRFKMNGYKAACKVNQKTIINVFNNLKSIQKELNLSIDDILLLLNRK